MPIKYHLDNKLSIDNVICIHTKECCTNMCVCVCVFDQNDNNNNNFL